MQKQIKYLDFKSEIKKRGKLYLTAVNNVFESGEYILGKSVAYFENEFAKYLDVKYCVGVANGLEAIQIALMSLDIGKGDEVITTPVSAVATTLAIIAVGATPVFTDIKPNGQIDETQIEKLITKKTKAVIPVDLYGQPCALDSIKILCKKHKLYLIEDACQAHGSTFKNKKLGTFGDIGCFSFYPTKNLGAFGDGGALVTNNKKLAEICRQIRDYGQESKYIHSRYGLNSRLDELHAALLTVKLNYLDYDNAIRRGIAERYIANLAKVGEIKIIIPEKLEDSNFHLFVIKAEKRAELKRFLSDKGIPTLIHYPLTIPQQLVIKSLNIKIQKLPVSERFVAETLSLPCHPDLTLKEVDYISRVIKNFFAVS